MALAKNTKSIEAAAIKALVQHGKFSRIFAEAGVKVALQRDPTLATNFEGLAGAAYNLITDGLHSFLKDDPRSN